MRLQNIFIKLKIIKSDYEKELKVRSQIWGYKEGLWKKSILQS